MIPLSSNIVSSPSGPVSRTRKVQLAPLYGVGSGTLRGHYSDYHCLPGTLMRNLGLPAFRITRPFANQLFSKLPPHAHLSSPCRFLHHESFHGRLAKWARRKRPSSINQFPILVEGAAAEIVFDCPVRSHVGLSDVAQVDIVTR
jgi:hypothetical protein